MRIDGRKANDLRKVKLTPHISRHAEGSLLVEFGDTKVLCTASVEPTIPKWLMGSGKGWITAEYGMLPRSTHTRMNREKTATGGRTQEISRLIARSLRAAADLKLLGEQQITVDCDVLQADGGTRTAAITGGFVALSLALQKMKIAGMIREMPLKNYVAAISVGLQKGEALLDLNYEEDSVIHTDMNFVMSSDDKFIEVQGTAEAHPFSKTELNNMIELASHGCRQLFAQQAEIIGSFFPLPKV